MSLEQSFKPELIFITWDLTIKMVHKTANAIKNSIFKTLLEVLIHFI